MAEGQPSQIFSNFAREAEGNITNNVGEPPPVIQEDQHQEKSRSPEPMDTTSPLASPMDTSDAGHLSQQESYTCIMQTDTEYIEHRFVQTHTYPLNTYSENMCALLHVTLITEGNCCSILHRESYQTLQGSSKVQRKRFISQRVESTSMPNEMNPEDSHESSYHFESIEESVIKRKDDGMTM